MAIGIENSFFDEQKDWSKRKLLIIQTYLSIFTKILGGGFPSTCAYYVDGFAGKGVYEDGAKGSPLLALELAQKFREEKKKYQLHCINVEENSRNYSNLVTATAAYQGIVDNLNGTFASNVNKILQKIDGCPAFFFIDPFGVKGTDWHDISKIIHRRPPTDLWLRFDHKTVRRLSGFFESGSRGTDSKVLRLLQYYGFQDAEALFNELDGNTPDDRIENAVNFYVERIESEFINRKDFGFASAFPIISLEGQNKYYLVFASAHPKAVMVASETVYSVEKTRPLDVQEYQLRKTGQPLLFSTELTDGEIAESISKDLANDISKLFKSKELKRREIYINLLKSNRKKWFGRFSSSHFNKALKILEEGSTPKIVKRQGGRSEDNSTFYFG